MATPSTSCLCSGTIHRASSPIARTCPTSQEMPDSIPNASGVKAEVRMMFVRPDADAEMTLLHNLVRLSRGKMIGVDFNKDLAWTGASVAIWPL